MQSPDRIWQRLLSAARQKPPPPAPPIGVEEVQSFSKRTVNAWKRPGQGPSEPDLLGLWERVGVWSVGAAAAALLVILLLHHGPSAPNPFEPFGPDRMDEAPLFAIIP